MIQVCVVPPFPEKSLPEFEGIPGVCLSYGLRADAEVILGQPTPRQIASCGALRLVESPNAGVDGYVARKEVFAGGIALTTVSGAFGQSISESVLAMVLSLYKHLNLFRDNQNICLWRDEGRQYSPEGKNLLILGAGDIGMRTARLFSVFGCHTVGMRRTKALPGGDFERFITLQELDGELLRADIVVCALPDTEETRGLMDARRLSLLKKDAVLVNVGRGSLIDGYALADALQKGRLFGAALDVTSPEPLPADHPLWKCKNCILTPHATGGSFGHLEATTRKVMEITKENLRRYAAGEPLLNRVNFETGYRDSENRYR